MIFFEAISFSFHVGEDEIFEQNYWSRKTSWGYAFAPSFKKNDTESAIKYIFYTEWRSNINS